MIKAEKHTFLPDTFKVFFHKMSIRLCGLFIIAAGIALAVALATYESTDPSLNTASGNIPKNALGYTGAVCADLLWQYFGLGAVLFPLALMAWGVLIVRLKWHRFQFLRVLCFIPTLFLLLVLFSALPAVSFTPVLAGFSGAVMPAFYHPLIHCLKIAYMPYLEYLMLPVIFVASIFGLASTLGIPFYLVKRWIAALGRWIKIAALFIWHKIRKTKEAKVQENEEKLPEELPQSLFAEQGELNLEEQPNPPRPAVKQPAKPSPLKSIREQRE